MSAGIRGFDRRTIRRSVVGNRIDKWVEGAAAGILRGCGDGEAPGSLTSRRMTMSVKLSAPTRRSVLAGSAAAGAVSVLPVDPGIAAEEATEANAIRPFRVNVPEEALV